MNAGRAALTQALAGMGGIGKTQTAIEYAVQYQDDYPAVTWVSADTEITIRTSIVAIAAGLGLQSPDDPDHNRAVDATQGMVRCQGGVAARLRQCGPSRIIEAVLAAPPAPYVGTTDSQAAGETSRALMALY